MREDMSSRRSAARVSPCHTLPTRFLSPTPRRAAAAALNPTLFSPPSPAPLILMAAQPVRRSC
jgi:hypothetical protein